MTNNVQYISICLLFIQIFSLVKDWTWKWTMAWPHMTPWPTTSAATSPGKAKKNLCSNWLRKVRNWPIMVSFPYFCLCFQIRIRESQIFSQINHIGCPISVSPPPAFLCQYSLIKAYLKLFPFFTLKISHYFACVWVSSRLRGWWLILLLWQALNK